MDLKMEDLRKARREADFNRFSTRTVAICKVLSVVAACFTASVGCYGTVLSAPQKFQINAPTLPPGFYLGWHTFNVDEEIDLVLSLVSFYMLCFGLMVLLVSNA